MNGVKIGDKHSYTDFGLILSSKIISPPKARIKLIDVPMRNGSIDLTEAVTGDIRYEDRKITLTFSVIDPQNTWTTKISEIENSLHGKRLKLIFDEDRAFYYIGRVSVDSWTSDRNIGKLVLECTVDPFKYDILSSSDDWLWDPFDFETGIINEMNSITVSNTTTVTLIGRNFSTTPTFTATAPMTLTYDGIVYELQEGTQKFYDLFLKEGENQLIFSGNGTVTIAYTGGSL